MKNLRITLQMIMLLLLFGFITFVNICHAEDGLVAIGKENAHISFYGQDDGVYYVITDPNGLRIGYSPSTHQEFEEFLASFGFGLKDTDSAGNEIGGRDEISDKFHGEAMFNLIPGNYTIEVIGVGLTPFDLSIRISRRIKSEGITEFDFKTLKLTQEQITAIKANFTDFHFEGITDKGLTSKFQMTYNSDPSKPAGSVVRVATSSSLKQDITLSQKIGWISEHVMKKLLEKVDDIEEAIKENNPSEAKEEVNDFIKEVKELEAEYKEVKEEETKEIIKKKIAPEAVKMFLEDAQYIMGKIGTATIK